MEELWSLKATDNINQMLRIRENLKVEDLGEFENLLVVKHQYHVADDIMFPDPACLAFFRAFEENHLMSLEEDSFRLMAIDIFEGAYRFYIYCKEPEKTVYDCIGFLKSNPLYKCEFEIIKEDKFKTFNSL